MFSAGFQRGACRNRDSDEAESAGQLRCGVDVQPPVQRVVGRRRIYARRVTSFYQRRSQAAGVMLRADLHRSSQMDGGGAKSGSNEERAIPRFQTS
jgi:hypothetical protein